MTGLMEVPGMLAHIARQQINLVADEAFPSLEYEPSSTLEAYV